MNNPKGGLVDVLKVKLDAERAKVQKLSQRYTAQRRENKMLRQQLNLLKKNHE